MTSTRSGSTPDTLSSQPLLHQHGTVVQEFGTVEQFPLGLSFDARMLSRLLAAHEQILVQSHEGAAEAAELGDDGTNDLFVSQIIRTGELQAWFLAEHLVDTPLARA